MKLEYVMRLGVGGSNKKTSHREGGYGHFLEHYINIITFDNSTNTIKLLKCLPFWLLPLIISF